MKFYVSMARDLRGVFIQYDAVSRKAMDEYIRKEYYVKEHQIYPWCSVYTEEPIWKPGFCPIHIIIADCGEIQEGDYV